MATLILEVQEKKLKFLKDILEHFSFVTIRDAEFEEDTDEQVIENIRQGVREMQLIEQGKAKSTPFCEFLSELDEV